MMTQLFHFLSHSQHTPLISEVVKWVSYLHAVISTVHILFQSLFIYKEYLSCSESTATGQLRDILTFLLASKGNQIKVIVALCAKKIGWSSGYFAPEGSLMILFPLLCLPCAHSVPIFLNLLLLFSLLDDISGTLPTSVLVAPMGSSLQSFPLPPPPPPHAPG